jgi:hypothetical protein
MLLISINNFKHRAVVFFILVQLLTSLSTTNSIQNRNMNADDVNVAGASSQSPITDKSFQNQHQSQQHQNNNSQSRVPFFMTTMTMFPEGASRCKMLFSKYSEILHSKMSSLVKRRHTLINFLEERERIFAARRGGHHFHALDSQSQKMTIISTKSLIQDLVSQIAKIGKLLCLLVRNLASTIFFFFKM